MEDLDHLRDKINIIDESLVKLFLERMDVVRSVAEYKMKNSMDVLDKTREEQIINKHLGSINDISQKSQLKEFLENLMSISRKAQGEILHESHYCEKMGCLEQPYRVGFQGVAGSFSEQALIEFFGDKTETKFYLNFKEIFDALNSDEIKYGIVPIENSSTGGISEIYDLLGKYNFYIVGEKCIEVNHHLLGINGADMSNIEEVYSHAQGFLQCSSFFENHPHLKFTPYFNTAKSAEYIKMENSKRKACIASRKAAQIYGLNILKENINNCTNNYTRFIIISKDIQLNAEGDKISVVVSLPHSVGALYGILKHFVENNSNLVKIESRPILEESWHYLFYIDFNGNLLDENTKNTLKGIEDECLYFKLLGNYKCEVNVINE